MNKDDLLQDIDLIYQAAANPIRWQEVAAVLAQRIGCTSVQLLSGNQQTGEVYHAYANALSLDDHAYYMQNIFANDQLIQSTQACLPGIVHSHNHIISDNQMRDTEAYQAFYKSRGMHHWLFTDIVRNEQERMCISFARAEEDTNFNQAELNYFQQLVPHLKNAQSINERFRAAQQNNQNTFEYFSQINQAVYAVNLNLQVQHLNAAAERFIKSKQVQVKLKHLILNDHNVQQRLFALLQHYHQSPIQAANNQSLIYGQYVIRIMLLNADISGQLHTGQKIAILIFEDNETQDQKIHRLSAMYSLTGKETQIVRLLTEGLPVSIISEMMSVTMAAIRFHLRNIFAKTRCHSQKELVLLFIKH